MIDHDDPRVEEITVDRWIIGPGGLTPPPRPVTFTGRKVFQYREHETETPRTYTLYETTLDRWVLVVQTYTHRQDVSSILVYKTVPFGLDV